LKSNFSSHTYHLKACGIARHTPVLIVVVLHCRCFAFSCKA